MKPKLTIFASGKKTGGGSGFENLCLASQSGILDAEIVAAVSNHAEGGVAEKAVKHGIKFIYMPAPFTPEAYKKIIDGVGAEWVALSGWLKMVEGLDPRRTFNIHPGPLPQFGGPGMYGHHVHEAVIETYKKSEVKHSAVTMHFVIPGYDKGPVFFRVAVPINDDDDAESLGKRVNEAEHKWQPIITNKVVHGKIGWDGKDPSSILGAELYY